MSCLWHHSLNTSISYFCSWHNHVSIHIRQHSVHVLPDLCIYPYAAVGNCLFLANAFFDCTLCSSCYIYRIGQVAVLVNFMSLISYNLVFTQLFVCTCMQCLCIPMSLLTYKLTRSFSVIENFIIFFMSQHR